MEYMIYTVHINYKLKKKKRQYLSHNDNTKKIKKINIIFFKKKLLNLKLIL